MCWRFFYSVDCSLMVQSLVFFMLFTAYLVAIRSCGGMMNNLTLKRANRHYDK